MPSTKSRENTIKPRADEKRTLARDPICPKLLEPVILTHNESSKFPHNRPMVPACVLIMPALNSPDAIVSSMTYMSYLLNAGFTFLDGNFCQIGKPLCEAQGNRLSQVL